MDPSNQRSEASARAKALVDFAQQQTAHAAKIGLTQPPSLPPDSILGYTLEREIRRGGQGIVYEAVQASTKQRVAIKVLRGSTGDSPADDARFRREVEVLSQFQHPNIVRLIDGGSIRDLRFFVMEFVPGTPLDAHVACEGMGAHETVKLFVQVCEAVNAAHVRGIVHRDLKPSNILVDAGGAPHVLDFGLAKLIARPDLERVTVTGQFVGSLPWSSPEQVDATTDVVDTRSDVYSLGLILFHALTQRFPYEVVGPPRRVMENIAAAQPLMPSSLGVRIDADLETILAKCLKKDAAERYQTAGELARELTRYLAGEAIEAKRDSTWYVLSKLARRHRIVVSAMAIVLLVVISSAIAMAVLYRQKAQAQLVAEGQRANAERRANELQAISGLMNRMIGSMREKPDAREAKFVDMLEMADDFVAEELPGQPLIEATFRIRVGEAFRRLGFYDRAEHHLRKAWEIRVRELGENDRETLVSQDRLGLLLNNADRLKEAEGILRDLERRLALTFGEDDGHTVWARMHRAEVLERDARFAEAGPLYDAALKSFTRNPGKDYQDYFDVMNNYFLFLHAAGRPAEAIELAKRAVATLEGAVGETAGTTVHTRSNLAMALQAAGQLSEAEQTFRRVIRIHRELYGAEHPDPLFRYLNNLAEVLQEHNRLDEAESLHREALAIRLGMAGGENADAMAIRLSLAEVLLAAGRIDEAEALAAECITGWRELRGEDNIDYLAARLFLVRVSLARGDLGKAEIELEATLEGHLVLAGAQHPRTLENRRWLAECQLEIGSAAAALQTVDEAIANAGAAFPEGHWRRTVLLGLRGRCLAAIGRKDEARNDLETALEVLEQSLGETHPETMHVTRVLAELP